MNASETGESTASIVRRTNHAGWQRVLPLLRAGLNLRRERTGNFYVEGHGGLTAAFVAKMERDGVLRRIGVDVYALTDDAMREEANDG
jgi:hypothetical protein